MIEARNEPLWRNTLPTKQANNANWLLWDYFLTDVLKKHLLKSRKSFICQQGWRIKPQKHKLATS